MKKISVIIPAYNEEEKIGEVIDKVKNTKFNSEIIVVDNCSTDKTSEIAKSKQVITVFCPNKGKGYAMEMGLQYATGEIVVFIDGDLGIYTDDIIGLMISPIMDRNVDFTKAAFTREGGRVTELVAKPLLELLFTGMDVFEQPLSGIIAGKKEFFDKITFEKDYGVDIGILLDMVNMKANIEQVHLGRIDNNSQSWKSLSDMAKQVANAILRRANYLKKEK